MTVYINVKENGMVETIDEFEAYNEARKMLKEYKILHSYYLGAYLSKRSTKEWRTK